MKSRHGRAVAIFALCPVVLAACTAQEEPDVATLPTAVAVASSVSPTGAPAEDGQAAQTADATPTPAGTTAEASQKERAEAMVSCLRQADLPAQLEDVDGGQADVTFTGDDLAVACAPSPDDPDGYPECRISGDLDLTKLTSKEVVEPGLTEAEAGQVVLLIGDQDYSAEYAACLDETGYTPSVFTVDPREELQDKQRQAEVAAEWAACARANGFPETKDPDPPVADNWASQPTALLPATITADQLRTLLQACPNFDAAAHQAAADAQAAGSDDEAIEAAGPIDPNIGFDLPGFDGTSIQEEPQGDPADLAHMQELNLVLLEAAQAFWAKWAGLDTVPTPVG
ncbi:MAG: hypothetical protein LBR27_03590 [Bifidobacteriaceae bacterium]|jgi:hypothetical protein|nr:hypothetical protein [Bifidobacteriaceae bacterium]